MTVLLVIIILVVLIVVHEIGHFIVAKLMGVRVEEFGLGYPPRAFTIGKWGETVYTLNWLPFGGFVRLYGEDEKHIAHHERKRSMVGAPLWSQALILVAGVAMNALAAWLLFSGAYMAGLPAAVSEETPDALVVVSAVVPNSPAAEAGILPGDQIVDVYTNRAAVDPLYPSEIVSFVQERGGTEITVEYMRQGTTTAVTVIPAHAVLEDLSGQPALGIALTSVAEQSLNPVAALGAGFTQTFSAFKHVSIGLFALVKDALTGGADLSQVVGPVGLVSVVGTAAGYGVGQILSIAAFVSVNLAIINLLPIPALDGGRLVFVGLEAVMRRPPKALVVQTLNFLGFALIIVLMIAVTWNDIARLIG